MEQPGTTRAGRFRPACDRERGMATVEMAVVLPALVLMLAAGLWLVAAAVGQLRCVDAAREGARTLARGDPQVLAIARAEAVAPASGRVRVAREPGWVRVTVTATVRPFSGWAGRLPALRLTATASAAEEGVR